MGPPGAARAARRRLYQGGSRALLTAPTPPWVGLGNRALRPAVLWRPPRRSSPAIGGLSPPVQTLPRASQALRVVEPHRLPLSRAIGAEALPSLEMARMALVRTHRFGDRVLGGRQSRAAGTPDKPRPERRQLSTGSAKRSVLANLPPAKSMKKRTLQQPGRSRDRHSASRAVAQSPGPPQKVGPKRDRGQRKSADDGSRPSAGPRPQDDHDDHCSHGAAQDGVDPDFVCSTGGDHATFRLFNDDTAFGDADALN